jgi:uncharacterized membrane protein YiaA
MAMLGIVVGYIFFNLGFWKSDSAPKPQDVFWALLMMAGTVLMFASVLKWAIPSFFHP